MVHNILEYLERSAGLYPDKAAFSDKNDRISFRELEESSRRIGSALARHISPRSPVVVCMGKSIQALCAFFGTVYAGGCYVPVDVSMPVKRMGMILKTLGDCPVITDGDITELSEECEGHRILPFSSLSGHDLCEDRLERIRSASVDTDPLYIIFTSGSTGTPKGVVQTHRAVIDFTEWFSGTAGLGPDTVFANQAPFFFDMSVKDIYGTLRNGASDHITPHELFSFPVKLFAWLNENRVNTLPWAVTAVCMCASEKAFRQELPETVTKVCFGGEALPVKVLNLWKRYLPDCMYMNMYGPTETAVDCAYYIVDREFAVSEQLPVGRPCANTDILILDGDRPVCDHETGEICVRGSSLSPGYYNDPEKTSETFVQNPLVKAYPDRIFRTGDLGYYNDRGEICFSSRKDDQIKHWCYRIELGEIEAALHAVPGIERSCCLFEKKHDRIICVYSGTADKREILLYLGKLLPRYMWPNKFLQIAEFPLNVNGKIDRQFLKDRYLNDSDQIT